MRNPYHKHLYISVNPSCDDSKLVYKLYCHVTSLWSLVATKQDRIAQVDLELIKSME